MKKQFRFRQQFLILLFIVSAQGVQAQQRPNIVFILADDLGWADLPVYGNRFNEAPHLQAMAKQGAVYTNAYAAAPVCSPTRASILSGQHPVRVGLLDFIPGHWRPYESVIVPQNRTQYLPTEIITIGETMKELGYQTGYFGRWNLGNESKHLPGEQGFNEVDAGRSRGDSGTKDKGQNQRSSTIIADLSESFIDRHQEEPFFLFIGSYDVHTPLTADSVLIAKYMAKPKVPGYPCNAVYAAMVEHVDQLVGRVLSKVKQAGLEDRTMVVFFSDNGGLDYNFGKSPVLALNKQYLYATDTLLYRATSNSPLRGGKGNLYEGGIREPLLIKYPQKWSGATVIENIVTSVDFYPSFVALAGGRMPGEQVFDGRDIFQGPQDRPVFWHYPVFHHGIPASAVRKGAYKLIRNLADSTQELYDIENDIGETTNLVSAHPAKAAELAGLLDAWLRDMAAPMPVPNPGFDVQKRFKWGRHPGKQERR